MTQTIQLILGLSNASRFSNLSLCHFGLQINYCTCQFVIAGGTYWCPALVYYYGFGLVKAAACHILPILSSPLPFFYHFLLLGLHQRVTFLMLANYGGI
jgi:hypothetical protein